MVTEIEAFELPVNMGPGVTRSWPGWAQEAHDANRISHSAGFFYVATAEGTMRAKPGDFVARDVEGNIYPIKRSVFEQTYQRIDELPHEGKAAAETG